MADMSSIPSSDDICRGINFRIRYTGCVRLGCSMRTLEFAARTAISKECIYRVCEAARFVTSRKPHTVDKLVVGLLQEISTAEVTDAGRDVELVISSRNFSTNCADSGVTLMTHPLPNISFASGGDQETCEFFCYVVKNEIGRHVHVFECGSLLLPQVLHTIQLAFSFRTQQTVNKSEIMARSPAVPPSPMNELASPLTDDAVNMSFTARLTTEQKLSLEQFYHGAITREESERLLNEDGEFLVRKSGKGNLPNGMPQFVLTGMQKHIPRHLLLLSDDGQVRTKDRQFESISHLIQYHRENSLPIVSDESVLVLKNPVIRR